MPKFTEFFQAWKKDKRNADFALMRTFLVGAVAAAIVGAAKGIADDERASARAAEEDARIQSAINRELKKRGLN